MDWCQSCTWWPITDVLPIGFGLKQDWPQIALGWHWIYTSRIRLGNPIGMTFDWLQIGTGVALDWHQIGNWLATDNPRVSASSIVPNGCVHCTVLASIFLDWPNIANLKLNLDWRRICAVLENCQYYWWVYMWDTCGIFIWYDVGCMWDLNESENLQI